MKNSMNDEKQGLGLSPQKRTLVVGLGKTGLSCVRFLQAQGFELAIIDSRLQPPGLSQLAEEFPNIAVFTGSFEPAVFDAADQIVVSPGVSLQEPELQRAAQRGVPILGDIELFARQINAANAMVIAITGSNGKSTVTTLLGMMAATAGRYVKVGGNLGTPALELLREVQVEAQVEPVDAYILELSSFQLETTTALNAAAAVVLNVSPDHMDRYATLDDYIAAKRRVYQGDGVMVVNADDPVVMAMIEPKRSILKFSLQETPIGHHFGLRYQGNQAWLCQGEQFLLPTSSLLIIGQHNIANALAALALGQVAGLPMDAMLEALRQFRGLAHRMQWVAEHQGISWFNDSKATNVGATLAALQGLPGKVILLAGGDGKAADFSELKAVVAQKTRAVVLFGKDAPLIEQALEQVVPVRVVKDLEQAVKLAKQHAQAGDTILLAPACASFDQYKNYEQRGDHFIDLVQRLVSGSGRPVGKHDETV